MDIGNVTEFNLILVNSKRYYCKICKAKIHLQDSRIPKKYNCTFAVIAKIFEYFQENRNLSITARLISKDTGLLVNYTKIRRIIDYFKGDPDYLQYIKKPFDLKSFATDNGPKMNNNLPIQFEIRKKNENIEKEPDIIVEAIDSIHSGKNGIQNGGKHCFTIIYDSKKKVL